MNQIRNQRILSWLALSFFTALAVPLSSFAQAQMAAPTTNGGASAPAPWMDSDSRRCGHECLYGHANNNLTIQGLFGLNKLKALNALDDHARFVELGDFCRPNENELDCWERYKIVQPLRLLQERESIKNNQLSLTALKSEGDRIPPVAVLHAKDEKTKKAQMPFVPTYKELNQRIKDQAQQDQSLQYSISEAWAKDQEIERELLSEPKESDFRDVQKKVSQSTSDKASADMVELTGKSDKKALESARSVLHPTGGDATKNQARQLRVRQLLTAPVGSVHRIVPVPGSVGSEPGDNTIAAYNDARAAVIKAANDSISGTPSGAAQGSSQVTFISSKDQRLNAAGGRSPAVQSTDPNIRLLTPAPDDKSKDVYTSYDTDSFQTAIDNAIQDP